MIQIAVLSLLACSGMLFGLWLMKRERETRVAALIYEMERSMGVTSGAGPQEERAAGSASRLAAGAARLMPAAMMESYAERLVQAGRPYGLDAGGLVGIKLVLALLLPALVPVVALFQLGSATLAMMLLAAAVGFIAPDLWLNALLGNRLRQVQEELPLFTDLIATAVSAGLSLTEAVRRVAADAPGVVAREFLRSVQEMAAGKPRLQAWRDLMDRLPGDEFRTIVTAIMQAEQYGTSVAEILRYQVQQIRTFKRAGCCSKILVRNPAIQGCCG